MDNISRFGVFLPTYIWDDDGPERARNLVAFARRVEELGLRLPVGDRPPARRAALLLRRLPGAAVDARRRRRRHRARPARHVGARAPDPPARGAREGALDAAVPVRQPLHPRRRRRLEPGRVPRHGRRQDPARQADRRDPRHRDPADGGGDGHLPRPATSRSTRCRSSRCPRAGPSCGSAAARSWPTRSRPTCRRSSRRSRSASSRPRAGSRAPPARPSSRRRTGRRSRPGCASAAATWTSSRSPTRTSCTSSTRTTPRRRAASSTRRSCGS